MKNGYPCVLMMRYSLENLCFRAPRVDAHYAATLRLTLDECRLEDAPLNRQRIFKSLRTVKTYLTDKRRVSDERHELVELSHF